VWRLYGLGFLDHVYLGLRPWTRSSLEHMLQDASKNIEDAQDRPESEEAEGIFNALERELRFDHDRACRKDQMTVRIASAYTVARGLSGMSLRDSFHLGSTIVNDYGRRYEPGFNSYTGVSGYAIAGRYTLYLRGEVQVASSAAGYSPDLFQALATVDDTVNPTSSVAYPNQATIPSGPISATARGRFLEAYVSAQLLNHVVSFGKQDEWLGPAQGASMAYSNNAENIYALHINRIEPLYIPGLSRYTGPFRYEFLVGALRGHTLMPNPLYPSTISLQRNVIAPGDPWVHVEKISFRPTDNLEFGFERTALWGGEGHSPVTIGTFLKSFFSLVAPQDPIKFSRSDPGARFGTFDFSWRLPGLRRWVTLYSDSEVHDNVSPVSAPPRSSYRPGIYLSHFPGAAKLDLRAEAASTDPSSSSAQQYAHFMYWENVERQGYTNQGQLFGDWIGREDKGGQVWLTYHLSGNEWVQLNARSQKATKDFIPASTSQLMSGSNFLIPGGTTLNDIGIEVVKRLKKDLEVRSDLVVEHWKAPIYLPGRQTVTATTIQITWFPDHQ
jgi:hypothetical protein